MIVSSSLITNDQLVEQNYDHSPIVPDTNDDHNPIVPDIISRVFYLCAGLLIVLALLVIPQLRQSNYIALNLIYSPSNSSVGFPGSLVSNMTCVHNSADIRAQRNVSYNL